MRRRDLLGLIPLPLFKWRVPTKSRAVVNWFIKQEMKHAKPNPRPFDYVDVGPEWVETPVGYRPSDKYHLSINRWAEGYDPYNSATWRDKAISHGWAYPDTFSTFEEAMKIGREVAQHFQCEFHFRGEERPRNIV